MQPQSRHKPGLGRCPKTCNGLEMHRECLSSTLTFFLSLKLGILSFLRLQLLDGFFTELREVEEELVRINLLGAPAVNSAERILEFELEGLGFELKLFVLEPKLLVLGFGCLGASR